MMPLLPLLSILFFASPGAGADYVVVNARVYTVSDDEPQAEAFAVAGGRFLMVGSNEGVLHAFPDAPRLDAGGRAIVPGLIDAHAHLMGQGRSMMRTDLVGTGSIEEVLGRLAAFDENLPEGTWLQGQGWDQNDWTDARYPTRADLDVRFPDRPVWLHRIDGHAAWANSAALRRIGIDRLRSMDDPAGGRIVRDGAGEPTGVFIDAAMDIVQREVPPPSGAEDVEALRRVLAETARYGLTGVHEAGLSLADMARYRQAIEEGWFNLRLYGMIGGPGPTQDAICAQGPFHDTTGRLDVRSLKLYIDGALGSRGAALLEPYTDDPGNLGLLQYDTATLTGIVARAIGCGLQVNTHAIGDRGVRTVLDAYEQAFGRAGQGPGRHRVEHAQIVSPEDVPRFKTLGVLASMQPTHATSDMPWAEERLGPERLKGAYAWRSFLDEGVRVPFGSDFPVERVDPLLGFYAAVTRQDANGEPDGGWMPEQRFTRAEALRAFTLDAAYAGFAEDEVGSIEPGKRADFVVLSKDIMTVPDREILQARVEATYLDGEAIFGGL